MMTTNQKSLNVDVKLNLPDNDCEQQATPDVEIIEFDYSKRSQWLRAAVLGATDGLVSIGSLMMGVGAVKQDVKAMILTGCAGLVAGACSMAIGEFVSVQSQLDIELAQIKRDNCKKGYRRTGRRGRQGEIAKPSAGICSFSCCLCDRCSGAIASCFLHRRVQAEAGSGGRSSDRGFGIVWVVRGCVGEGTDYQVIPYDFDRRMVRYGHHCWSNQVDRCKWTISIAVFYTLNSGR
ncbi:VACUOLAR IRON TRANSPORTER-LIKE PROTEIN 3 [Salix viminalis]|uniref:Vacuolar iron transporter n=1 Tax=Salix viminalis TaxID=40686 RepID=A0A9Q0NP82_SALVM|nr:VACUOLAR IRON TRANSPORTER-LIKE PROTEIN 3 [Salix viminalis]